MPYIKQDQREVYDEKINDLLETIINVQMYNKSICGDMNYIITRLIHGAYGLVEAPRYSNINEAIGVLECAKLEVYRRRAAPYEDKKIKENGDLDE